MRLNGNNVVVVGKGNRFQNFRLVMVLIRDTITAAHAILPTSEKDKLAGQDKDIWRVESIN